MNLLAIEPGTAWSVMTILFICTLAIPFTVGWRWGWRAGFVATGVWASLGFALFYATGDLGIGEAFGVALFVFAVPWTAALAGGATVRRRRVTG